MARAALLALFALVAACTGTGTARSVGPPAVLESAGASAQAADVGAMLPPGVLVGRVESFDGHAFGPAGGVAVSAPDQGLVATTDADGRFGFQQLPAGTVKLHVEATGSAPFTLVCRLASTAGLARANLALVPDARPSALAGDAVAIAGVLTDPRGAALPGGTVHAVDSVSHDGKGGNEKVTADADGFFAYMMPGMARAATKNGQVELQGYGFTPGGVPVETTDIVTLPLDFRPTQAVVLGTTAFAPVASPAWDGGTGRTRSLTGDRVPQRRDELVLHFEQDGRTGDVAPDALAPGRVTFTMPDGFSPGHGTLEPRSLGLVPAPTVTIGP